MRKAPRSPAPATKGATPDLREERTYRFLTPVFGGGVTVEGQKKPADPRTPVRVPSIRGQLRFWWRACNPAGCETVKELAAKEEAIFGSTSQPSLLGIAVKMGPDVTRDFAVLEGPYAAVGNRMGLAYGAFPLRDKGGNHGVLHEHSGDWTLVLTYPADCREHVEAALWAWAHFGGLGGRTRRGFGAIAEIGRTAGKTLSISEGWGRHVKGIEGVPWPHLPKAPRLAIGPKRSTGIDAQEYLLGALRRLRQGEIGRKPTWDDEEGRHPGRSYWPEADAIRKLTKKSKPSHKQPVTKVDAFPRAVFGMPIIFDFNDRTNTDPPKTTLLPVVDGERKGRLASALILRPHFVSERVIEPLALVLSHPEPSSLVLVNEAKREIPAGTWKLTESQARNIGVPPRPSPLLDRDKQAHTDPLARFLKEIS